MKFLNIIFLFLFYAIQILNAQYTIPVISRYNQHQLFGPLFYPQMNNELRTASGMPGVKYWQNLADYQLPVSLDTAQHSVIETSLITYSNNSPGISCSNN